MSGDQIVIELIAGPADGFIKHFESDPGEMITIPVQAAPGYWPWENRAIYFWKGRETEDGRRAYEYAQYHPLRFS